MGRWQPLPGTLDPDLHRLVVQLRRLKDRSGLSLVALAARTPYSKSAWQRYLNGVKFPPRQAVEAIGRLTGADAARLLALWGLAERSRRDIAAACHTACPAAAVTAGPARQALPDLPAPADSPGPSTPPQVDPQLSAWRDLPSADPAAAQRRRVPAALLPAVAAMVVAALLCLLGPVDGGAAARTVRDVVRSLLGTRPPATLGGLHTSTPRRGTAVLRAPAVRAAPAVLRAPVCRADGCQGRDPYTTGCSHDARTAAAVRVDGRTVQLRYSARCRAAWAELAPGGPPGGLPGGLAVEGDDGTVLAAAWPRTRSPMLTTSDPTHTRACGTINDTQACAWPPS
ncbi:DUF2690 domain-containing protein [Streptomyces sp. NPDC092296]|uniref:helix-turn-helix domain-containing protein n=1 Tax=Streptomyces sp. NPDC092296 TaxID=3366012 RepID=UPI00381EB636